MVVSDLDFAGSGTVEMFLCLVLELVSDPLIKDVSRDEFFGRKLKREVEEPPILSIYITVKLVATTGTLVTTFCCGNRYILLIILEFELEGPVEVC